MHRLLLVFVVACTGGGNQPIEETTVSPLRVPCVAEGTFMCLQLVDDDGSTSRVFFGIEGFTHRWGHEARIRFHTEEIEDPPADGASQLLILDELISETQIVTAPFDLVFADAPPGVAWFFGTGEPLDMVGTDVLCDPAVCDGIVARSEATTAFTVTMQLTGDDQVLRAESVQ